MTHVQLLYDLSDNANLFGHKQNNRPPDNATEEGGGKRHKPLNLTDSEYCRIFVSLVEAGQYNGNINNMVENMTCTSDVFQLWKIRGVQTRKGKCIIWSGEEWGNTRCRVC